MGFIEDPEENPTIYNLLRYAQALKLDIGNVLSECLESHLTDQPPPKSAGRKPKK